MPNSDLRDLFTDLYKPQQISGKYPFTLMYETQRTGFDRRPDRQSGGFFFVLCVERNEKEKMGLESGERWLRLKACTVLAEVWSSVPAVT